MPLLPNSPKRKYKDPPVDAALDQILTNVEVNIITTEIEKLIAVSTAQQTALNTKADHSGANEPIFSNSETIAVSSTINLDLDSRDNFQLNGVLNVNTTISATNLKKGQVITLEIKQDAVGGRTITLSSDFESFEGSLDFDLTANAWNIITGKVVDTDHAGTLKIFYSNIIKL